MLGCKGLKSSFLQWVFHIGCELNWEINQNQINLICRFCASHFKAFKSISSWIHSSRPIFVKPMGLTDPFIFFPLFSSLKFLYVINNYLISSVCSSVGESVTTSGNSFFINQSPHRSLQDNKTNTQHSEQLLSLWRKALKHKKVITVKIEGNWPVQEKLLVWASSWKGIQLIL